MLRGLLVEDRKFFLKIFVGQQSLVLDRLGALLRDQLLDLKAVKTRVLPPVPLDANADPLRPNVRGTTAPAFLNGGALLLGPIKSLSEFVDFGLCLSPCLLYYWGDKPFALSKRSRVSKFAGAYLGSLRSGRVRNCVLQATGLVFHCGLLFAPLTALKSFKMI